jgi:NAD(P)H-flavin reductase
MSTVTMEHDIISRHDPMVPESATIRAIRPEAYGISTFTLAFDDPATAKKYSFQPGQFNMLYLPGFGEVAISMSSDPAQPDVLEHTIRYAGNVTRAMGRLKPGDILGVRGPYGTAWPVKQAEGKDLLIVTGGIGLAPLRPMILTVLRRRSDFGRVVLLYGARTPQDLLYTAQFPEWQKQGIEVHVSVDRADEHWRGQVGVVPMLFYRININHARVMVLTCGPEIMMRFVIYEALARRVPKESIFVSMERNMKCGVGLCGHCQLGPHFICRQGPVLNYATLEPFFGREDF